jgi:IPT/TIG domain
VIIGGTAAANVTVTSATAITATTPTHAAGAVNVIVTNSNGLSGSLANGFTYSAPSETVLLEDSFNDNSLDFAKWTPHNLFSGFTDTAVFASSQAASNDCLTQAQPGPIHPDCRDQSSRLSHTRVQELPEAGFSREFIPFEFLSTKMAMMTD